MERLGIILASHGDFAKGALNCIETIIGKVEDTAVITVREGSNVDDIASQMSEEYQRLIKTNDEIFIFTDIVCGTPCNVAAKLLLTQRHLTVFAGFNIPMLLEVFTKRNDEQCSTKKLAEYLKSSFASTLAVFSEEMKGEEKIWQ